MKDQDDEQQQIGAPLRYDVKAIDPAKQEHELRISINLEDDGERAFLNVQLDYINGVFLGQAINPLADWTASREHPSPYDQPGAADVGGGERKLPMEWRGSGIGTVLQSILTLWIKEQPNVILEEIFFSRSDVVDSDGDINVVALNRRQNFWEKFGFQFDLSEDGSSGHSKRMYSNKLQVPKLRRSNSRGWILDLPSDLQESLVATD